MRFLKFLTTAAEHTLQALQKLFKRFHTHLKYLFGKPDENSFLMKIFTKTSIHGFNHVANTHYTAPERYQ